MEIIKIIGKNKSPAKVVKKTEFKETPFFSIFSSKSVEIIDEAKGIKKRELKIKTRSFVDRYSMSPSFIKISLRTKNNKK